MYAYVWTVSAGGFVPAGQANNQDLSGLLAGTYDVIVTDANSCTTTRSINISQPAAALSITNISSNSPICQNETLNLTGAPTGGTPDYRYSWSGPGGFSSTLQNPTITGALPTQSGTYTVTVTDVNGCTASASTNVIVRSVLTASISRPAPVCQNAPNPVITITNPQTIPVVVTYNVNAGANSTINVPASGSSTIAHPTATAGSFTYNLVSVAYQSAPTCSNPIIGSATVTVYPTPTVNPIADQTICANANTLITALTGPVTGTTFTWTNSNTAIGLAASGTGNVPSFTTTNTTLTPISGTITIFPTANGCPGTPLNYRITVNPTPTATISGGRTVCQNSTSPLVTFTNPTSLAISVTYNINGTLQTPVAVTGNGTAIVSVPTTTAGTFNYNLVSVAFQSNPICTTGLSGTTTFVVNPQPVAAAVPASQAICSANAMNPIVLSSGTPNASFNWTVSQTNVSGASPGTGTSISQTLSATTSAPGSVLYTITPTANSCSGTPLTATVTVNPIPVATITPAAQTRCSGVALANIVPTSATSGTTYDWTRDHISDVTGLPASGIGTISGALTNATNAPITVTITFVPRANGCTGMPVTATAIIEPTVAISNMTVTVCNNNLFTTAPVNGINGMVPAGTTYDWSVQSATSGVTGATSGSGTSITGNLNNSTNLLQTVVYAVTPRYNGCIGSLFTLTVNVTPNPAVSNMITTVCSNRAFTITPVNGVNGVVPAGTQYTWSVPVVSGGVTGGAAGSGSNITGTLVNPTNSPQIATYIVTPSIAGCTGANFTVIVTVDPAPAINQISQNVCSGTGFSFTPQNGTNGVIPVGTTYSWAAPTVTGGITGGAVGSGASAITGTLTNPGSSVETATYTVTPVSGNCSGTPFEITVNVYPLPAINPITQTMCSRGSFSVTPVDGTNGIVPAGTTYNWLAPTVTGNMTGGEAGSGLNAIGGSLTNPTNTDQTATYSVTPMSGSCPGISFQVIVTVRPTPSLIPMTASVCSGSIFTITPVNGTNGIIPAGTSFSWGIPILTGGITGGEIGSGTSLTGTLVNPSMQVQTATYSVTPSASTCTGSAQTVTLSVYPTPTPTIAVTGPVIVCSNGTTNIAFTNPQAIPVTITYNINGSASSTIDVAASSTATIPATTNVSGTFNYNLVSVEYQETPSCQVTVSRTVTVTVEPFTTVAISRSPAGTICYGVPVNFTAAIANTGTNPSYQWYLNNVAIQGETGISFTSTTLENTDRVSMVVTTSDTPCPGNISSNEITMTVNPTVTPAVSIYESANPVCDGSSVTFTAYDIINGGSSPSFQWYIGTNPVSGATGTTFTTNTLTDGDQVRLVMISTATCASNPAESNTVTMDISPNLSVSVSIAESANPVCAGTSVTFTATPSNDGTTPSYQWRVNGTNVGSNSSTYSYTPANGDVVRVILTSSETCTSGNPATSNAVTIAHNPAIPATPGVIAGPASVCPGTPSTYSIGAVANATGYTWNVPSGWTITSGQNSTTITVTSGASGQNGTITVTASNECGISAAAILPVTVGTLSTNPSGISVTNNNTCFGTNKTLTVTGGSLGTGAVWEWFTGSCGGTPAGSGTSITVNPVAGSNTEYFVRAAGSCNTTTCASANVTVSPAAPAQPGAITGTSSVCPLITGLTYTIHSVANANSYTWTVPTGWTITAGQGTTSITATSGTAGQNGNISVTASNSCGTSPVSTFAVAVNPGTPASPGLISGLSNLCSGTTGQVYSITPVANASSYTWSVPGDWTITSGTGTNSITVTAGSASGNISVTAENSCGTSAASILPVLAVLAPPDQPGAITGVTAICPVKTLTYTISPVTGAIDYLWALPANWTLVSGQGTSSISVTVPSNGASGSISVIARNVCGNSIPSTLEVTVASTAWVNAGPDQIVCVGTPTIQLSGSVGGAINRQNEWDWVLLDVGTLSNATRLDAVYSLPNNGNTLGVYTVRIQSLVSAVGCDQTSDDMTVTVVAAPTANAGGPNETCQSVNPSPITLSGASVGGGATTGAWSIVSGGGSLSSIAQTANPSAVSYTPAANFSGTVTIRLTTNVPGNCTPATSIRTITVYPAATANAGTYLPICSGSPVTLNGSVGGGATSGIWTGGAGTFIPNNSTLNATYTPTASEIAAGSVTLTLTTNDPAGPCGPVSSSIVLTINPVAITSAGNPQTICAGNKATMAGSYGGGATSATWSTSGTGTFNNNTTTAVYTPSAEDISAGSVTLIYITNDPDGPCVSVSSSMVLTINPAATVSAGGAQTICAGSTATMAGSFGGSATSATWSTSGTGTFNNNTTTAVYTPGVADISAGSVTLTYTTNDPEGLCGPVSSSMVLTINPAATVSAGGDQTICAGSSVAMAGSFGGSAASAVWSTSGTGSFNNINTPTAVYTPSTTDTIAGSVTLTYTTNDPEGVCGPAIASAVITILPAPTVNTGTYDSICSGSTVTLNGSVGGGAASGSWTGGAGTFNPNRSTLNAIYTPTAAEIAAGSFTLSLTTNDPAGPCGAVSSTTTVTIYRAVTITRQPVNTGTCAGNPADLIVEATGSGLIYQWYKNGVLIPGATSATLHFNSVSLADEASYYVVVSGTSPCSPVTSGTVTLNVDAAITINTQTASLIRCAGSNVSFSVNASANGVPLNYQWRKGGVDIPGATTSTLSISNITTADAGSYNVVIRGDAGFTCASATSSVATLTVNTDGIIALISGSATSSVCVNTPLSDVRYSVGGSATGAVLSGVLPAGVNGSFSSGVFTISGTPTVAGTFNYTVTTNGSPCGNPFVSGTITVEGVGTISLAGGNATPTVCINNQLGTITYAIGGNATGASITAGSLPPGVSGSYNSTNRLFTISGTPTASGSYPFTVSSNGSPCVESFVVRNHFRYRKCNAGINNR